VLCGLLAGCAGVGNTANDPLYGPSAPPLASGRTAVQAGGPGTVPPLPAPNAATSAAALAGGRLQPLNVNQDLRIGRPNSDGWRGPGAQAGAILRQPEVVGDTPSRSKETPAVGITLAGGTRGLSMEQVLAQLKDRGVSFYRLETGDNGEYRFSCSIPDRQNPNIQHRYESQAREPAAALRAVLEQIEKGR